MYILLFLSDICSGEDKYTLNRVLSNIKFTHRAYQGSRLYAHGFRDLSSCRRTRSRVLTFNFFLKSAGIGGGTLSRVHLGQRDFCSSGASAIIQFGRLHVCTIQVCTLRLATVQRFLLWTSQACRWTAGANRNIYPASQLAASTH